MDRRKASAGVYVCVFVPYERRLKFVDEHRASIRDGIIESAVRKRNLVGESFRKLFINRRVYFSLLIVVRCSNGRK